MKRKVFSLLLSLSLIVPIVGTVPITVYAKSISLEEAQQQVDGDLSGIDSSSSDSDNENSSSGNSSSSRSSSNDSDSDSIFNDVNTDEIDTNEGISNYFKSYRPIKDSNMKTAQKFASPAVNACGNLAGIVILCVGGGIFVITALDMAYLCLPFTRNWLYTGGEQSSGMGSGMGMSGGYGGMGGMGMSGGMSGGQQQKVRQLISDDAIASLQEAGGSQQQSGGMGMSMSMGMQGSQQTPRKQVLLVYFKKRVFFLVLFGLCSVLLFSSVFIGCGINIAQLIFKLIGAFNNTIGGAY